MARMTVTDWISRLKYLESSRVTYYDNSFPGNCGEINRDGSISFDCIGMVKSIINEPDIVYKKSPAGYYVKPGQVIPDTTERGILNLCSDVSYAFNNLTPGEYLYMNGHAGVYVGDFTDPSGVVNVIECTPAFGGGVTTSYVDSAGRRWNHRGGYQVMAWGAHGKLSNYIDYGSQPKPTPGKVVVDGEWGFATTALAQKVFGTEVDGEVSHQLKSCQKYCLNCVPKGENGGSWVFDSSRGYSPLIKAIQKWCGAEQDGRMGPDTIKAMQKKLNVGVDGYCGPETVKAWQTFLNSKV